MALWELFHRWQTRDHPENMLTEAEATEHVRRYAEAHQLDFLPPISIHLERREMKPGERDSGFRFLYIMVLGTRIPMPTAEVDAVTGEVVRWRTLPR